MFSDKHRSDRAGENAFRKPSAGTSIPSHAPSLRCALTLFWLLAGIATPLAPARASAKVILPAEETGPMTLNFVQGYRFDPLREQPALPAGLSATEPEGEYGY
ncbi:MAG TPA: hypothetical protein ENN51_01560, partial [candidate division WOR-3 bacterium]|nr:hypothetical protein [candidate division WOR-3 bacterium]